MIAGIVFFIFTFALATRSLVPHTITEKTSSQECLKNAPDALPSTSLLFLLYQQLPLAITSMLWGVITSLHLPANLNYISIVLYANVTGCNVEEALERDLSKYETLSQFFTRRLRAGVRPISTSSSLVSPSDGKLTYSGPVEGEYLQQVKGVRYSLATFLGNNVPNWPKSETTSLYQAVVYLSPSDYHRYNICISSCDNPKCLDVNLTQLQVPLTSGLDNNPPTSLPWSTLQRPAICRCCFPWVSISPTYSYFKNTQIPLHVLGFGLKHSFQALPHKRACCLLWDLATWFHGDGGSWGNKCWQHRCRL